MSPVRRVPPGSTIGMLGGGQLGRMTALAAARLGYRTHVLAAERDSPCAAVAAEATVADYADRAALDAFAAAVDVVTLEWENIPVDTVAYLARRVPVHPAADVLAVTQDRLAEKTLATSLGIATAPHRAARSPAELSEAVAALGTPAVLKSTRLGYDGRGQVRIDEPFEAEEAWRRMAAPVGIVERLVDFACEVSVIVARGQDGAMATYPVVENRHANHILDRTIVPAAVGRATAATADAAARRLAEALQVVGLLAVEMFVTKDGAVLVNELAPRPHNSGHWTLDAGTTSQFEQLVRCVCGLPLGSTERVADAVMENLIGDAVRRWPELLAEPGAFVHLYGKTEVRPGRKMGHVTRLGPRSDDP